MAEIITNTRNKRHIWIAVMLSLILPGLGQIYCGKLARGLLLSILNTVPVSLIFVAFLFENMLMLILVAVGLTVFDIIIQLVAIIDSIYLVKSIGPDYKLKDYNRWYVYLLLILMGGGCSSTGVASYVKNNICEAFVITTASNYPTMFLDDRILANKIVYLKADPQRGDMVFYLDPENRRETCIKRVVAVGGDRVEM
jgi:signal peptidase I